MSMVSKKTLYLANPYGFSAQQLASFPGSFPATPRGLAPIPTFSRSIAHSGCRLLDRITLTGFAIPLLYFTPLGEDEASGDRLIPGSGLSTAADSARSRYSKSIPIFRSHAAAVRLAEVMKIGSSSATTALACKTPPGPSSSRARGS